MMVTHVRFLRMVLYCTVHMLYVLWLESYFFHSVYGILQHPTTYSFINMDIYNLLLHNLLELENTFLDLLGRTPRDGNNLT